MTLIQWQTGALVKVPARNVQVSFDSSGKNARSESTVAANPNNPKQIVCASKRFRAETPLDPSQPAPESYEFVIAPYWSDDGGFHWTQVELQRHADWPNSTDPVLVWDNEGTAYLMVLPLGPAPALDFRGVAVYTSSDGGQSWSAPNLIHVGTGDDKGWMTTDTSARAYAAWDDTAAGGSMGFARRDGMQWKGAGNQPAGSDMPGVVDSFSPALTVDSNGTLWIFWLAGAAGQIKYVTSSDNGATFTLPQTAVTNVVTVDRIGTKDGWPVLPGASFRLETMATCCSVGDGVVVAWADARETIPSGRVSRIYYRMFSHRFDWLGTDSGEPLMKGAARSGPDQHAFDPQLAVSSDGTIGCAFYEFGPKTPGGPGLIDVVLATPRLNSAKASFLVDVFTPGLLSQRIKVTDGPWDPALDAPWSHGDRNVTFVGDYFGCCGSDHGWDLVWTDTRTAIQELFFARVQKEVLTVNIPDLTAKILFGVIQDGGGVIWIPGHGPVPVPPRGPERDVLIAAMISDLAKRLSNSEQRSQIEGAASRLGKGK